MLDCGQRDYRDSELNLLKSSSAVTSTLRGLLKDSMGQVIDAALNFRATRAHALPWPLNRAHRNAHALATLFLGTTISQRYFLKFCHTEFSSENPEYWLAVQASERSTGQPPCSA